MEIVNPVILDQCGKDISDSFSKTLCSLEKNHQYR